MEKIARYEIQPRTAESGGGWRLQLFDEEDVEIGGGSFPLAAYADDDDPSTAAYADALSEARRAVACMPLVSFAPKRAE